ncbi:MAG TPA: FAD-binding oxidoreductase [Steroidobacteraceae bacterium]|nr:FAD-binding oxidoreductase [Steroidobacteraceae bacterium]
MIRSQPDILVIGGGIAGASAAAELARTHRVVVLEAEAAPGYHSTGRSAAVFSETYGNRAVRALTRASRDFFHQPPTQFSPYPLLKRRSWLHVASEAQAFALEGFLAMEDVALRVSRIGQAEVLALSPLLKPETAAAGGAYERDAADIDVDAVHQGYLRLLRHRGGTVLTDAQVTSLARRGGKWLLESTAGAFQAAVVINAAGAWADAVAALAGIEPMRIQACRRTAVLVELAGEPISDAWPLTIDIEEAYYFKPDAGLLLISPADETPVEPCDVQPEELDVAIAIDRVEKATRASIGRVRRKWAGLRSFAPDRSPVIGFDEAAPGFFWLAGQGGYGIQTAPAAAALTAALVRDDARPPELASFDPSEVSPARFTGSQRPATDRRS